MAYCLINMNVFSMTMKSTKVQTLSANTICVSDWSCAGEKLANTTTATGAMLHTLITDTTVLKQASGTSSSIYSNAGLGSAAH